MAGGDGVFSETFEELKIYCRSHCGMTQPVVYFRMSPGEERYWKCSVRVEDIMGDWKRAISDGKTKQDALENTSIALLLLLTYRKNESCLKPKRSVPAMKTINASSEAAVVGE